MRIAILQAKAASMGLQVPDDVLNMIAQRAHRNIRDMEGALTRVLAHMELFQRPLNAALVEDALAYLAPPRTSQPWRRSWRPPALTSGSASPS